MVSAFLSRLHCTLRRNSRKTSANRTPLLNLEALEDRRVMATFTVTSLLDAPNGGSLRQAIDLANTTPGPDDIQFAVSGTIMLSSDLPAIEEALIINGPGQSALTVDGDARSYRVFAIEPSTSGATFSVEIREMTITESANPIRNSYEYNVSILAEDLLITQNDNAIFSQGNLEIRNSVISQNTASPGIPNGIVFGGNELQLADSQITNNDPGASIYAVNSYGEVTLTNSNVSGNSSAYYGGSGVHASTTATITDSIISDHPHLGVRALRVMLVDSDVTNNGSGDYNDGGVFASEVADSLRSNVSHNMGTGIRSLGGVVVEDSTINQNGSPTVGYSDGGIFAFSDIDLLNSTVSGNYGRSTALYSAAGIHGLNVTLTNSTVSGNTLEGNAGVIGLSAIRAAGYFYSQNSTVSGNTAISQNGVGSTGAAIFTRGGSIYHSTIANNTVSYGGVVNGYSVGVRLDFGSLDISNSILAQQPATGSSPEISAPYGGYVFANYSLFGDVQGLTIAGTGNLIGDGLNGPGHIDPMLATLANNGGTTDTHALLANSPALDMGDPAALPGGGMVPLFDQRGMGFSRVENGRIDMGAYEQQTAPNGDFDNDNDWDCDDIDALIVEIVSGANNPLFDLNGDTLVDVADRDKWLEFAGAAPGSPTNGAAFLLGDADLNGSVDGQDFLAWNDNKFTNQASWCKGDFTASGVIDGQDFLTWNDHKFMSADRALAVDDPRETTKATDYVHSKAGSATIMESSRADFNAAAPQLRGHRDHGTRASVERWRRLPEQSQANELGPDLNPAPSSWPEKGF